MIILNYENKQTGAWFNFPNDDIEKFSMIARELKKNDDRLLSKKREQLKNVLNNLAIKKGI